MISSAAIRAHGPCKGRWKVHLKHLGKTRPSKTLYPFETCLDSNGFNDALWALRAVEGHDGAVRLFACCCAKRVLPVFEKEYPDNKLPREAIETAERFARGEATTEELDAARDAADRDAADWDAADWDPARVAARIAVRAAAWDAAWAVARAVARDATRAADWAAAARDAADRDTADWDAADWDAAEDDFADEFRRMCRLEGEYGEVDK
jgi:hypothetical protein